MTRAYLRRLWPLLAVAVLLALAATASAHTSLQVTRVNPPIEDAPRLPEYVPEAPTQSPLATDVAPANQNALPDWIFTVAVVIGGLIVVGIVGVFLWMLFRDVFRRRLRGSRRSERTGPRSAERTAAEVVAALDAGLVDLSDGDSDPRRAVIACWVRLEQAAAGAGIHRQVGDTPTDLVTRLLRGAPGTPGATGASPAIVSADVLAAFAEVYREARYATHTVDERMRDQARSALTRLRAELTSEVPR